MVSGTRSLSGSGNIRSGIGDLGMYRSRVFFVFHGICGGNAYQLFPYGLVSDGDIAR